MDRTRHSILQPKVQRASYSVLRDRIFEISKKYNLSHLGSCVTAAPIIDEIYNLKQTDEKFVLSAGHAALALYVVIERYEGVDAEGIFNHHGVHPDRCTKCHLYVSTGSLGNGLPIALGMALATPDKNVYCLISDGECAEGSIWESLNIREKYQVNNLKIYVNFNGWGAYDPPMPRLQDKLVAFGVDQRNIRFTGPEENFLKGQQGHYVTL